NMPTTGTTTIIDPETLLSKAGVAKLLGCNPWSIDRMRKQAERQRRENGATPAELFPQPVWLTDTSPRWRRVDILRWLEHRPSGRLAPSWQRHPRARGDQARAATPRRRRRQE